MIFFTGASGVFGTSLLSLPLRNEILSLVRKPLDGREASVLGDLTRRRCGLSAEDLRRVRAETRIVIHAAADTRFDTPIARARAINVEGTRRVLEIAAGCPHLKLFIHVSTVHVAGLTPGVLREEPIAEMPAFPNAYEQSKFEAEVLVRDAMRTLPVTIFRLSTLAGCENTGSLERENYLHRLIRLVPAYPLPVLPANPEALVDVVSVNWTARAFADLLEKAEPGSIYQLSAGPQNALPLAEAVDRAFHAFGRKTPRLVSTEATQSLLRRVPHALAEHLLQTLNSVLPHFQVRQEYRNTETMKLLGPAFAPPPSIEIYRRVLHRLASPASERASA